MADKLYLPASFFTLRLPFWSREDCERVLEKKDWVTEVLNLYASSSHLQEAISLASPSLHQALEQKPLKNARQVAATLLNYVVRMSTRATPFGLFAFVGIGSWGTKTTAGIDLKRIQKKSRPEMASVYESIQKHPNLVQTNPLARLQGSRVILKYLIGQEGKEVSIRANGLVKAILVLAKKPIAIEDLWKALKIAISILEKGKTLEVIQTLLNQQILLPDELLGSISPKESSELQVDAAYLGKFNLSKTVCEELEKAISLLWKISSRKPSRLNLEKFIKKYGTDRTVPLLDLLNEDHFQTQEPPKGKFADFWNEKWQRCLVERKQEIVLTEQEIDELIGEESDPCDAPPSLEVFCKVFAESSAHVDRGEFDILLSQLNWMGGSSLGRFLYLFDPHVEDQLRDYFHQEEQLEPDSIFFELSYWPSSPHFANVVVHPCLREMRVDLGKLEEIYVGATENRFYLTLKEGKRELVPRACNLLNPSYGPTICQFLHEVARERHTQILPFSWGIKGVFFPRVRFGKVILSPARWYLTEQKGTFTQWADFWALPKRFLLMEEDKTLLLDRTHPAHIAEISKRLKRGESLQFIEEDGSSWIESERGCHLAEFVIPFLKNPVYAKHSSFIPKPYLEVPTEERWKLPGSEWLSIKFYLDDEGMDSFLVSHLAPFAEELGGAGWYFVRYSDPERHIRFRIRLATDISLVHKIASTWMKEGLIKKMVIDSYEREIERYGGLEMMEKCEEFFCADTLGVIQLLSTSKETPIFQTLAVISFINDLNLNPDEVLGKKDKKGLEGFRKYKEQLLTQAKTLTENPIFNAASQLRRSKCPMGATLETYHSLLHMHCNRLGCDREMENRARCYARECYHVLYSISYGRQTFFTSKLTR